MRLVDMRAFGYSLSAEEAERERQNMDLGRFRVAFDAGAAVGVAGSWDAADDAARWPVRTRPVA